MLVSKIKIKPQMANFIYEGCVDNSRLICRNYLYLKANFKCRGPFFILDTIINSKIYFQLTVIKWLMRSLGFRKTKTSN